MSHWAGLRTAVPSWALGLCAGLLQGWQDPPAAKLKTQFQEKKYLNKRLSVLQGPLGEQGTWSLQHDIAAGWKINVWPNCILKWSSGVHWGQRTMSCYTGHIVPLHSLSKFSISLFSTGKVMHFPTQQKGKMVVFKDHEHLVEVLRAVWHREPHTRLFAACHSWRCVGKQPHGALTVSHRSALQSTVCSRSAHLAWHWQAGTSWMRGKFILKASSSESKHDIF